MARRRAALLGLAVLALAILISAGAAGAEASSSGEASRPRKILIVSMAGLTWEDVAAGRAPALASLARDWSVGVLSIRSVGSRTDSASAFASLGAGNRARGGGPTDMELAPNAAPAPGGGLMVGQWKEVLADNASLHFGATPGALGEALQRAGLRTAVVGNADGGAVPPDATRRRARGRERRRFAPLALADSDGKVDGGDVGAHLAMADPSVPSGYRADPASMLSAARAALSQAEVVLVELADTYREGQVAYASLLTVDVPRPDENLPTRIEAIGRDDALLGDLLGEVDLGRDTVFVLGASGIGPTHRERLMVAAVAGVGAAREGWLTSATTRRDGIVTISDVAPGILRQLGIDPPLSMNGLPIRAVPAGEGRLDRLLDTQASALFHARWVGVFFPAFVGLHFIIYLVAWRRLSRGRADRARVLRVLILGFMGIPVATLVQAGAGSERLGIWQVVAVLIATSAVIAALALAGPWSRRASGPPAFVCGVSVLVIALDLMTGARLQLSSLMGYSPIVAGRFAGLGNLMFAVLATSAILATSALAGRFPRYGAGLAALVGGMTILLDGAPGLGADFGGVLALVPAFGVLLILLRGRRPSWARMALLIAAGAAVGLIVGLLDAQRPPEVQTHIGRFVGRLIEGGPSAVSNVILRKITANWGILTGSVLSLSIPIAGAFLVLVLLRPVPELTATLHAEPGLKAGLLAAGVANLLGFALNDSGVAIPAMGLAVGVPYLLATVLAAVEARPEDGHGGGHRDRPGPAHSPTGVASQQPGSRSRGYELR